MPSHLELIAKAATGYKLSRIEKATISIGDLASDGGLLPPEKAQQFILLLIKASKLLPLVEVITMAAPSREVTGVKMGARVLRPGVSNTRLAEGDRSKPLTSSVLLESSFFKAEIVIDDEVLEDNIEGEGFLDTVMEIVTQSVALDMDDIIWNGDQGSGDATLAVLDGVRIQITSNLFDFESESLRPDTLTDAFKTLPTRYKRDRQNMKWFVSPNALEDYREVYAQRATDLGDRNRDGLIPLRHAGVEITDLPVMPEDLTPGNLSELVLINPKSIKVGIQRAIKMETWRDPREGATSIVVTVRFDVKVFEEESAVKGQNVLAA